MLKYYAAKLKIYCFFICLLAFGNLFSQEDYFFQAHYIEQNVLGNKITAITQDPYGFVWLGSEKQGIVRYNGLNYKFFDKSINFEKYDGLTSVNSFYTDWNSDLWAVSESKGLGFFNKSEQEFSFYSLTERKEDHPSFSSMVQTAEDEYYVGSRTMGLFKLSYSKDTALRIVKAYTNPSASCFHQISKNQTLIGAKGQIFELSSENRIKVFIDLSKYNDVFKNQEIIKITPIDNSKILAVSSGGYFFKIDLLSQSLDKSFQLPAAYRYSINDAIVDHINGLWCATNNGLIYCENLDTVRIRHIKRREGVLGTLNSDKILSLYEDENNSLWIGTGRNLNRISAYQKVFPLYRAKPFSFSEKENSVYSISEINDSTLVMGYDGKLGFHNSKSNKLIDFLDLGGAKARDLLTNEQDHFILTEKRILKYSREKGLLDTLITLPDNTDGRDIEMAGRKILLASSKGLYVLDYSADSTSFELLSHKGDWLDKVYYNNINKIIKIDSTEIWLGTRRGLSKIKWADNILEHVPVFEKDEKNKELLFSINTGIFFRGMLWLGTDSRSLVALKISHDCCELTFQMNRNTQLDVPTRSIYSLIATQDQLWFSSNTGITVMDPETFEFRSYTNEPGLTQNQLIVRSAYFSNDRKLYFGGNYGVNHFYAESLLINPNKAGVIFNKLVLLDKVNSKTGKNREIPIYFKDTINLNYDQNIFSVILSSDDFTKPGHTEYYYKLENYDNDWVKAASNTITLNNMPSGTHILKVKSINEDDIKNEVPGQITIIIETPFWQSGGFLVMILVIFISLLLIIYRQYFIAEEKEKGKLEKLVAERTQRLESQKDLIEDNNKKLQESEENLKQLNKKKDLLFSILSHDLRSPLTTLQGFLNLFIESYDSISPEQAKSHAEKIKKSVASSLDLLDNTLYWSLSQMGKVKCNPSSVNVRSLLKSAVNHSLLSIEKKGIVLETHFKDVPILVDENMANVVFRNLLSNSVKFTPNGGQISVTVKEESEFVKIIFSDTGIGISESNMEKLFKTDENFITKGTSNEKGTGLGLLLCKNFTDMNGGKLTVSSTIGYGTTFTVSFKKDPEERVQIKNKAADYS